MIPAALLALAVGIDQSVVLEGFVPLAAGKPSAHVQVLHPSGGITNEGCSGGELYTGHFVVRVTPPGLGSVESDLNALLRAGDISFPAPPDSGAWPIHFVDLNGDGQPDFAIAQHFCSDNGRYSLFTIHPDGRVSRISVVPEDPMVFDDAPSSSSLHPVPGGFRADYYDNSTGSGATRTYRWDASRGAFTLVGGSDGPATRREPSASLSDEAALELIIPGYSKLVGRTRLGSDGSPDPLTSYSASIFSSRRTSLGVQGGDFLVVLVHQVDTECTACHSSVFGVIDLSTRKVLTTRKDEGIPTALVVGKAKRGLWPVTYTRWVGNRFGAEFQNRAEPRRTDQGEIAFEYAEPKELSRVREEF